MKLEREIVAIKRRNERVEADKAWETSMTRRILVAVLTYLSLALTMWAIGIERPFVNAIVPTGGFILSTLSLAYFRKIWEGYFHHHGG